MAAVLSEEVFNQLCKRGVRLPGGRHEVDAFEEERPDALCLRCGGWGHGTPHCEARDPKCAICAAGHAMKDHRCSVEGCRVGRGRMCPHTTAKCANCGGPHGARADVCVARKIAQHASRGWRSPPPPRRERRGRFLVLWPRASRRRAYRRSRWRRWEERNREPWGSSELLSFLLSLVRYGGDVWFLVALFLLFVFVFSGGTGEKETL